MSELSTRLAERPHRCEDIVALRAVASVSVGVENVARTIHGTSATVGTIRALDIAWRFQDASGPYGVEAVDASARCRL